MLKKFRFSLDITYNSTIASEEFVDSVEFFNNMCSAYCTRIDFDISNSVVKLRFIEVEGFKILKAIINLQKYVKFDVYDCGLKVYPRNEYSIDMEGIEFRGIQIAPFDVKVFDTEDDDLVSYTIHFNYREIA